MNLGNEDGAFEGIDVMVIILMLLLLFGLALLIAL